MTLTLALPMAIPPSAAREVPWEPGPRVIPSTTKLVLDWLRAERELRPVATRKCRREALYERAKRHNVEWWATAREWLLSPPFIRSWDTSDAARIGGVWIFVRTTVGTIRLCERHRRTADSLPGDVQCADDSDAGRALALACALERMGRRHELFRQSTDAPLITSVGPL